MTREETIEAIKVMQAYVDGAEIQVLDMDDGETWVEVNPNWDWEYTRYRIKPKLELRVGAWYELRSGTVMQCQKIESKYISDCRGWSAHKDHIVREVRVLPVEE